MSDMNHLTIRGRLTKDANLIHTPSGTALLKFSIAQNYSRKEGNAWKDYVNYFDIVFWGKQAEKMNLDKGTLVFITGELKQDRWDQDGQSRSKVVITAHTIDIVVAKREEQKETATVGQEGFVDDIPL